MVDEGIWRREIWVYKVDLHANTIALNLNSDFEYLNMYLKPLKFARHGKKILLVDCKNLLWYDRKEKKQEA